MRFGIGMRNIKTAITVFLCVLISRLLKLEYPFYAAIAGIISMENSMANSFKAGKNRMKGTLAGAFIGLIFASIQPNNALLCGLGIVAVIYVCNLLKWTHSISIAGVVFMAIMLNLNGKSPLLYSANRILDTFIGISVALLVNYLISPIRNEDKLMESSRVIAEKIALIVRQMICHGRTADLDELRMEITKATGQYTIYTTEFSSRKSAGSKIDRVNRALELYKDVYEHLHIIQKLPEERALSADNMERLKSLNYSCTEEQKHYSDELNIVYNYHVSRIIDGLQKIQQSE